MGLFGMFGWNKRQNRRDNKRWAREMTREARKYPPGSGMYRSGMAQAEYHRGAASNPADPYGVRRTAHRGRR